MDDEIGGWARCAREGAVNSAANNPSNKYKCDAQLLQQWFINILSLSFSFFHSQINAYSRRFCTERARCMCFISIFCRPLPPLCLFFFLLAFRFSPWCGIRYSAEKWAAHYHRRSASAAVGVIWFVATPLDSVVFAQTLSVHPFCVYFGWAAPHTDPRLKRSLFHIFANFRIQSAAWHWKFFHTSFFTFSFDLASLFFMVTWLGFRWQETNTAAASDSVHPKW